MTCMLRPVHAVAPAPPLLQTPQGPCAVCGSKGIDVVPDVIELAIEQTLDADGGLELVRSATARRALAPIGPPTAVLRW